MPLFSWYNKKREKQKKKTWNHAHMQVFLPDSFNKIVNVKQS